MVVKIGSRISKPSDWNQIDPDTWQIVTRTSQGDKRLTVSHVAFGNTQCVICGEPIQATPGESDKCNECFYKLANYLQGMKMTRAWEKRITEWRNEQRSRCV